MRCDKFDRLTMLSFVAGDLDTFTARSIDEHLKECTLCDAMIKEIKQERSNFLKQYPKPEKVPEHTAGRVHHFRHGPLLALAASLVLVVSGAYLVYTNTSIDGYRIKGTTQVSLFVQDENGSPVKRDNSIYYPGEKIQFTYSCGERHYFMLLSADSNKSITVYYPSDGDSSIALEPGRDLPLPNSITLDKYLGPELYLAVFSAFPLHATHITAKFSKALNSSGSLRDLRFNIENAVIQSIVVEKKEHAQ
ncbi:MAG: DUF4384 domain-containing protein [Chitinispirillaceae bacterium]|nr:DUF4384 domain-containing protein [Chitinispirillaceae bacterium]